MAAFRHAQTGYAIIPPPPRPGERRVEESDRDDEMSPVEVAAAVASMVGPALYAEIEADGAAAGGAVLPRIMRLVAAVSAGIERCGLEECLLRAAGSLAHVLCLASVHGAPEADWPRKPLARLHGWRGAVLRGAVRAPAALALYAHEGGAERVYEVMSAYLTGEEICAELLRPAPPAPDGGPTATDTAALLEAGGFMNDTVMLLLSTHKDIGVDMLQAVYERLRARAPVDGATTEGLLAVLAREIAFLRAGGLPPAPPTTEATGGTPPAPLTTEAGGEAGPPLMAPAAAPTPPAAAVSAPVAAPTA